MANKSTNSFFNFSLRKDLTAIIKPGCSISYYDLFNRANQIASSFSKSGIKSNDYIPLLIDANVCFIETTIALWKSGAVPVPLNSRLSDTEIAYLIKDYNFKFLISDKELSSEHQSNEIRIINPLSIKSDQFENAELLTHELETASVVILTSGSTGKPKGVVHTFNSLINSIINGNEILNQIEGDGWLASLPFYHIGGFQILCRSLYYGCSLIIPESLHANHLADAIVRFKPTFISLVSVQLERLLHQKIKTPETLKVSLIGGGIIDDDLMLGAFKLGWQPYRVYGSSETASFITAISGKMIKTKPQSVGQALRNVEIIISDDSEILVKSNSLFIKYLEDNSDTSSYFMHGFYHTGDLGFVDDEGYLFIESKRNDLIVTGGENVNPIEIEKILTQLPFIEDACVFPKRSKTWGQIVAAAIVSNDTSVSEKEIIKLLKQKLAGYKIPQKFFVVNKLPRTSLGKLERDKIKRMF